MLLLFINKHLLLNHQIKTIMAIEIQSVNYLGHSDTNDFNAKSLYTKNGKTYLVHIKVDYFNKRIYISKNQPKECKALVGLSQALNDYYTACNGLFSKLNK